MSEVKFNGVTKNRQLSDVNVETKLEIVYNKQFQIIIQLTLCGRSPRCAVVCIQAYELKWSLANGRLIDCDFLRVSVRLFSSLESWKLFRGPQQNAQRKKKQLNDLCKNQEVSLML